jgi:hypothetical protein
MKRRHKKNTKGGIILALISTVGVIGWIRSIIACKELDETTKEKNDVTEERDCYRSFIHLWRDTLKRHAENDNDWKAQYKMRGKDSKEILKEVVEYYYEDYDDVTE